MIRIRPAGAFDLDAIFAIYDREVLGGTSTFETTPKSPDERLAWFHAHAPPRYPLVVSVEGEQITGWAGATPWSPRSAYARTAESSVYVRHDRRGTELGKQLMRNLMEHCRRGGIRVLIARVVEGNPASVRLHETLGFQTIGVMRRVGEKFGLLLDVRLMDCHFDNGM